MTQEEIKLREHSPFFDDELPRLVEAVYDEWTGTDVLSESCCDAVRELCEARDEMLE